MVHDRSELEAGIKAWDEAGFTCAPAIQERRLEDGHVVSYVLTLGDHVYDVRMSCPDGTMTSKGGVVFACVHGEFDTERLIGISSWPGFRAWPGMPGSLP